MMFDTMCGIVERAVPSLSSTMKRARLFRIDTSGWQRPDTPSDDIDETEFFDNFNLPFDTVCVEEAASRESSGTTCSVISRSKDDGRFGVAVCFVGEHGSGAVLHGSVDYALVDKKVRATRYALTMHPFAGKSVESPRVIEWKEGDHDLDRETPEDFESAYACLSHEEKLRRVDDDLARLREAHAVACAKMATIRVQLTMLYLAYINDMRHFIMEECPPANLPKPHPEKIVRSPWRSHFIALTATEIRRRLAMPTPEPSEHGKRAPHERRGHWRRFLSERYVNAKGQRKWIDAMWIGPREAILGPNKYVVRLDL